MELLRWARVVVAIYIIVVSFLLYRQRKHGIEVVIFLYGVHVLLFYVEYFFDNLNVELLNTWSSLTGLHAALILAFYCTEKFILLKGIEKAHKGIKEKE